MIAHEPETETQPTPLPDSLDTGEELPIIKQAFKDHAPELYQVAAWRWSHGKHLGKFGVLVLSNPAIAEAVLKQAQALAARANGQPNS